MWHVGVASDSVRTVAEVGALVNRVGQMTAAGAVAEAGLTVGAAVCHQSPLVKVMLKAAGAGSKGTETAAGAAAAAVKLIAPPPAHAALVAAPARTAATAVNVTQKAAIAVQRLSQQPLFKERVLA